MGKPDSQSCDEMSEGRAQQMPNKIVDSHEECHGHSSTRLDYKDGKHEIKP